MLEGGWGHTPLSLDKEQQYLSRETVKRRRKHSNKLFVYIVWFQGFLMHPQVLLLLLALKTFRCRGF